MALPAQLPQGSIPWTATGQPNGIATLDSTGKIPAAQIGTVVTTTALPAIQPIACRTGSAGQAGINAATTTAENVRSKHKLPYGTIGDVSVVEQGWWCGSGAFEYTTENPNGGVKTILDISVVAGGTGWSVGDRLFMPTVTGDGRAATLRVDAVSAGAITKVSIRDGGVYITLLADGTGPASSLTGSTVSNGTVGTAGSGSGATFNFTWTDRGDAYAHIVLEPTWGTQSVLTTLTKGVEPGGKSIKELVIPSGGVIATDRANITVPLNGYIGVRRFKQGGLIPTQRLLIPSVEFSGVGTVSLADASSSGSVGVVASGSISTPFVILGRPQPGLTSTTWLLMLSDSIGGGTTSGANTADIGDTDGNVGPVERGAASAYPFINMARGSDAYRLWFSQGFQMRLNALISSGINFSQCIAVDQIVVNDIGGGSPTTGAADARANKIKIWNMLLGLGCKGIITATSTHPQLSSTDGFTTVANQTLNSKASQELLYNSNLRTDFAAGNLAQYGIVKVVDQAQAVDAGYIANGTYTGFWPVGQVGTASAGVTNWTGDGIHPQQTIVTSVLAPLWATALTGL